MRSMTANLIIQGVCFLMFLIFTRALPDSVWSEWVDGPCSVSCGPPEGTLTRVRSCSTFGGPSCVGSATKVISCLPSTCGPVSLWSEWVNVPESVWSTWVDGPCSVSCGPLEGTLTRVRSCSTFGGLPCVGSATKVISCLPFACDAPSLQERLAKCFSTKGECVGTCGLGTRQISTLCGDELKVDTEQCDLKKPCRPTTIAAQPSNTQSQVVNGDYGEWNPWGPCSGTCLAAGQLPTRTRTRDCNMPLPSANGASCEPRLGPSSQTVFCESVPPCGTSTSSPTTTALTCPRNRVSCPAGCCRQRRQNNQRQRQGRRQGQRRGQRQGQRRRQGLGHAQGQSRRQPVNKRCNQVRAG